MSAFLAPGDERLLSAMSFNLRYPAHDGHPWPRRRPGACALVGQEMPHVIATQEGLLDQLTEFVGGLDSRYAWTGEGREGGDAGEFTAVVYDQRRLRLTSSTSRWLSETPEVPSRSWGSSLPRISTIVDFTDAVTGRELRVISTHLDHRSEKARLRSTELLIDWAGDGPCLVMGDFNEGPEGEVHAALLAGGFSDAAADPGRRTGRDIATFHGYRKPKLGGPAIDWIMHTSALTPLSHGINEFRLEDQAPSDHWPVQALLEYAEHPEDRASS